MRHFRLNLVTVLFLSFICGQERDHIIFPHRLHLEVLELECDGCHEGVEKASSLAVRLLPPQDFCLECHDGEVAPDECSACHSNPEEPQTYAEVPLRPGPSFSHIFHLSKRPDCADCHEYVFYDDGLAPPTLWRGQDCRGCHEKSPPGSHTSDWTWLHGMEVSHLTEENCMLCHSQVSCDACHQLQQFEPKVHPASYLLSHGFDARSGITDCVSCHQVQTDCQGCHRDLQIMPMDHNLPGWAGPEFVFDEGGLHAQAALDAPEVCIACHEPASGTCQRCHGE